MLFRLISDNFDRTSTNTAVLMLGIPSATWSPGRKWETVSLDGSRLIATKTGAEAYGYVQSSEVVSTGVHTW